MQNKSNSKVIITLLIQISCQAIKKNMEMKIIEVVSESKNLVLFLLDKLGRYLGMSASFLVHT